MHSQNGKKHNKKRLLVLLTALFLIMAACVVVIVIEWNKWFPKTDFDPSVYHPTQLSPDVTEVTVPDMTAQTVPETEAELRDNPIRFDELQALNSSVYAWVYVPDTGVDYPILQSASDEDDNYYLHRNIYRLYEYQGTVYTQKGNSKDFTDRVTVVYGHNMLNDSMFSNLDMFLDKEFFDAHPQFFIYTPGHILTYEIVSAHQYDKRHILNSFDFSDDAVFEEWLAMAQDPKTVVKNVRSGIELTTDSRIVILSTCIQRGAARYLIQGVLISDEPTK